MSFFPTLNTLIERMPYEPYCSSNLLEGVRIRKKEAALNDKYIQINPPSTVQAFCIDIDNEYAFEAHNEANVLAPSIFVQNIQNGHGHGIYMIKTPIGTSAKARHAPQAWLAGIERGYTRRLGGDVGYSGLLCRNPLTHPITDYGRLYDLAELDSCLDFGDKSPYYNIQEEHGTGRNVTMFDTARAWAYRQVANYGCHASFHAAVLQKCCEINAGFRFQLSHSEPRATAKSIAKWTWKNRFEFSDRNKVNRGSYNCSRQEAGIITASRVQTANEIKIEQAIHKITKAGKTPTHACIASIAGVSTKTIQRHFNRVSGHA